MEIVKKLVVWAEAGTTEKPNDVKIQAGWNITPVEQPPAKWFNWILKTDEENINSLIDSNNSYDTELSTVISAAGLTPDLSPTGPGNQLLQSLMTGGLIVDGGLGDDLDLGHFVSGTLNLGTTSTNRLEFFGKDGFTLYKYTGAVGEDDFTEFAADSITMNTNAPSEPENTSIIRGMIDVVDYLGNHLEYAGRGIRYQSGYGDATFNASYWREAEFETSGTAWTVLPSENYFFQNDGDITTDISAEFAPRDVIFASVRVSTGAGASIVWDVYPVKVKTKIVANMLVIDHLFLSAPSLPNSTFSIILKFRG